MQTTIQTPPNGVSAEAALRKWHAGFIEDAEDLHLARKPIFATVIKSMLENNETRNLFIKYAPGGQERLDKLEEIIYEVQKRATNRCKLCPALLQLVYKRLRSRYLKTGKPIDSDTGNLQR